MKRSYYIVLIAVCLLCLAAHPFYEYLIVGNGATSAGYVDFREDTDNGANRVRLIGPSSTADVDVTLPAGTGTLINSGHTFTGNVTATLGSGGTTALSIANNQVTGAMIAMGSDASGDVLYYNGTDYVRLAKGADGTVLKLSSGIPAWGTDNTAGSPTWDTLGDAAGDGSVAFGGTTQVITSTLDNGIVLELTDTDADAAADTTLLKLSHNSEADDHVIYLSMFRDKDGGGGGAVADYIFKQDGATFNKLLTATAGISATTLEGDGAGITGIDATLISNLEDTIEAFTLDLGTVNVTTLNATTFAPAALDFDGTTDATLDRSGAGDLTIESNIIYRAGGTDVPVTDGGTGRSTGTTAYALVATGTTATGAQQTLASGATTEILVGGGAAALPVWTTATGTGAPVRDGSPTLTSPTLGTIAGGIGTALTALQHLTNGADPDISTEGDISYETDIDQIRGYDGTQQVSLARKIVQIDATVIKPNDLADAQRDACYIWVNASGMSFIVTGWNGMSDVDDTDLNIEEVDGDGQNNATVDAVTIATNGTGIFTGADTTITGATIENGHRLVLDFDDTDAPGIVQITIYGYYAPP